MWPNDNRNIILFPFLFNINNGNPRIDIINYLMELCSTVQWRRRSTQKCFHKRTNKNGGVGAHSLCILCFPETISLNTVECIRVSRDQRLGDGFKPSAAKLRQGSFCIRR